uniref:uncharacterized protein LOC118155360 n=1 Tax=Callithrix jacchus TaxID=9483 RepID=UPI0023DD5E04|nr:uncharacterized protein LOC118155360 [Callithrix jacchus]XP_054114853.1 uncharacterized protein LOC118155360 [Callithrix jacchus]
MRARAPPRSLPAVGPEGEAALPAAHGAAAAARPCPREPEPPSRARVTLATRLPRPRHSSSPSAPPRAAVQLPGAAGTERAACSRRPGPAGRGLRGTFRAGPGPAGGAGPGAAPPPPPSSPAAAAPHSAADPLLGDALLPPPRAAALLGGSVPNIRSWELPPGRAETSEAWFCTAGMSHPSLSLEFLIRKVRFLPQAS